MKFGVCGYLRGKNEDGQEFDLPAAARAAGFDYIEMPLSTVAGLVEKDFEEVLRNLERSGLACEACNLFFPGSLRLTGPEADPAKTEAYLNLALGRANRLGARVIVFGSGGARNVPPGFPMEQAWAQLAQMLRLAGEIAGRYGIDIAIEPLNRAESNLINTGSEGYALARVADHPRVGLLLDLYHMVKEGEDYGIAVTAREVLRHAHLAEPAGRRFPVKIDDEIRGFFSSLKRAQYDGRVSVEAGYTRFEEEARAALAVMRAAAG